MLNQMYSSITTGVKLRSCVVENLPGVPDMIYPELNFSKSTDLDRILCSLKSQSDVSFNFLDLVQNSVGVSQCAT